MKVMNLKRSFFFCRERNNYVHKWFSYVDNARYTPLMNLLEVKNFVIIKINNCFERV